MKTYEVTGVPLGAPFTILTDRRIGDRFDADLDDEIERALLGSGALVVIDETPEPEPEPPEPEPEPEPVPAKAKVEDEPKVKAAPKRSRASSTVRKR